MKTTIKDLEKVYAELKLECDENRQRIEKLEKQLNNADFVTCMSVEPQPKYKVGDKVEVKGFGECTIRDIEDIAGYLVNDKIGRYISIPKEDIIGYAKPDILTQEEKEYLQAVIKPFRDRIKYITKLTESLIIGFPTTMYAIPLCYNFDGLERSKDYTLSELGL